MIKESKHEIYTYFILYHEKHYSVPTSPVFMSVNKEL